MDWLFCVICVNKCKDYWYESSNSSQSRKTNNTVLISKKNKQRNNEGDTKDANNSYKNKWNFVNYRLKYNVFKRFKCKALTWETIYKKKHTCYFVKKINIILNLNLTLNTPMT